MRYGFQKQVFILLFFLMSAFLSEEVLAKAELRWKEKAFREKCEKLFVLEKERKLQAIEQVVFDSCSEEKRAFLLQKEKEDPKYNKKTQQGNQEWELWVKSLILKRRGQGLPDLSLFTGFGMFNVLDDVQKGSMKPDWNNHVFIENCEHYLFLEKEGKLKDDLEYIIAEECKVGLKQKKANEVKKQSSQKIPSSSSSSSPEWHWWFVAMSFDQHRGFGLTLEFVSTYHFNLGVSGVKSQLFDREVEAYIKAGLGTYQKLFQLGIKLSVLGYQTNSHTDFKRGTAYAFYMGTHLKRFHISLHLGEIVGEMTARIYLGFVF